MDVSHGAEDLGPGPIVEHERAALDPTGPVDDGRSELERHKAARGYTKPAAEAPPAPEPLPEPAGAPLPEAAKEPAKPERWNDPDTGDTYDMRHKVARRIKKVLEERAKVTERAERAERERDDLLRRMAAPAQRPTQTAVPEAAGHDPEPDPADTAKYPEGQYDRAFVRDMSKWAARSETRTQFDTVRAEGETRQRQAAETRAVSQWQQTLPETIKKYPDFEDVLGRIPTTPENAPIVRLMMGSPVGNDLVYVLGTQPQAMDAYKRAPSADHRLRLLYHLEAQLIAAQRSPSPSSTTRAPLPTSPVHAGAGPTGPIDWSRTDDPEQLARWKAVRKR